MCDLLSVWRSLEQSAVTTLTESMWLSEDILIQYRLQYWMEIQVNQCSHLKPIHTLVRVSESKVRAS